MAVLVTTLPTFGCTKFFGDVAIVNEQNPNTGSEETKTIFRKLESPTYISLDHISRIISEFEDHCHSLKKQKSYEINYHFYNKNLTREGAEKYCKVRGGLLPEVRDTANTIDIMKEMRDHNVTATHAGIYNDGMNMVFQDGKFRSHFYNSPMCNVEGVLWNSRNWTWSYSLKGNTDSKSLIVCPFTEKKLPVVCMFNDTHLFSGSELSSKCETSFLILAKTLNVSKGQIGIVYPEKQVEIFSLVEEPSVSHEKKSKYNEIDKVQGSNFMFAASILFLINIIIIMITICICLYMFRPK